MFISYTTYFVLLLLVVGLYVIFQKGIVVIPKRNGAFPFLLYIVIATILGYVSNNGLRNVARDAFYILPSFTMIYFGYIIYQYIESQRFWKIIFLVYTFISLGSYINVLLNPSILTSMTMLRNAFSTGLQEMTFLLPIVFLKAFIEKEYVFSKKVDVFIFCLLLFEVILSCSRTCWVIAGVTIFAIYLIYNRHKIMKVVIYTGAFVLVFACIYTFLPNSPIHEFWDKMSSSLEEVDASQYYGSSTYGGENWRAYENAMAISQWSDSGILGQIFGKGLGTVIDLGFVPASWKNWIDVSTNGIPLLHNAYYTLLPKVGILGVFLYILFFLMQILLGISACKWGRQSRIDGVILIAWMIAMLLVNYATRGLVTQSLYLVFCLGTGWINADISNEEMIAES